MQTSTAIGAQELGPTPVLDFEHPCVRALRDEVRGEDLSAREFLRSAHQLIARRIAPVYTVDEFQPASLTIAKGRGSCSQRLACLEALARARGIPTQVHARWISGRFWYPRFYLSRPFIPRRILLAWPQFHVGDEWLSVECLFGTLTELAKKTPHGFSNDSETLFDAIAGTAVDFDGVTAAPQCSSARCDLSDFVVGDGGIFPSRDWLFATLGSFQHTIRGCAFELLFGGK